ncbi:hypothetical protein D3C75_203450 [compost metagenome]
MSKNKFPIPFEQLFDNFSSHLLKELFKDGFMNMVPDYSPNSLLVVEEKLLKHFNSKGKELSQEVFAGIIPIGYYYGETLVRNIPGAYWKIDNNELIRDQIVAIPTDKVPGYNRAYVKPFTAVGRYCIDQEKGLFELYNEMVHIAQ